MAMAEILKNLVLVKNEMKYFEFIRTLRNDPLLKGGFIDQKEITSEEHAIYMNKFHNAYFICLLEDQPVGYVGVVDNDIRILNFTVIE